MKRLLLIAAVMLPLAQPCAAGQDVMSTLYKAYRIISGASKAYEAFTVTDEDLAGYMSQVLAQEDAKHKVCQKGSAYDQRLRRITKGMTHLFSTHPDLEERIERLEKMR